MSLMFDGRRVFLTSLQDLKADNILVEMSGVCKISDFGISKRTDDNGAGNCYARDRILDGS